MFTVNLFIPAVACTVAVFLLPFPGGFSEAAEGCTNLNETVCCKTNGCSFISCTLNATFNHTGCHDLSDANDTAIKDCNLKNVSQLANFTKCSGVAPAESCEDLNETQCCSTTDNLNCSYITKCNDTTVTTPYCTANNVTVLQEKCGKSPDSYNDTCSVVPSTTLVPPTSSQAPSPGVCTNLNETVCCKTNGCSLISCISATVNHTGCHNLSDTSDAASAAKDCNVTPSELANVTKCGGITPAPSCEGLNETQCCSTTDNLNCSYITKCNNATVTTPYCTAKNKTALEEKCGTVGNYTDTCDVSPASSSVKPPTSTQTPSTPVSSSTVPTTARPSSGGKCQGQHFDGASFVGGIILCAGIVALIFFGIKFYRSRQERNYHTL